MSNNNELEKMFYKILGGLISAAIVYMVIAVSQVWSLTHQVEELSRDVEKIDINITRIHEDAMDHAHRITSLEEHSH